MRTRAPITLLALLASVPLPATALAQTAPTPEATPVAPVVPAATATSTLAASASATPPAASSAATPAASASTASASGASADTKYQLGVRIGFSVPLGGISDALGGTLPIWVDGGYRFSPRLILGGYARFALAFTVPGCIASCSGYALGLGGEAHYHLDPFLGLDPWIGAGVGFEDISFGGESGSGFEVNAQGGLDYKPGFGPFVGFAYDSYSGGLSGEWITVGVRGTYDW
jgi:hypothetical protein